MDLFAYAREHPVIAGGGALVAVVALAAIIHARNNAGVAASASGIDPVAAQLTSQAAQLSAQGSADTLASQTQIDLAQISAGYGVQAATIAANRDITLSNTSAASQDLSTQANELLGEKSIAAQLQGLQDNNDVSRTALGVQLATTQSQLDVTKYLADVTANEQIQLADIGAKTTIGVSNNQTQVALAQTQGAVTLGVTTSNNAASVANTSSTNNLIGSVVGAALAFL